MRHFLFEDKPYRINPNFKRKKSDQDAVMTLAKLLRKHSSRKGKTRASFYASKGKSFSIIKKPSDIRQKCVAKMQYSKSGAAHKVQLEKYLVREGTDIDGSRAKLYGTDIKEYQQNMVDLNFRIFLSPQSDKVDLKDLGERFIKTLEQQTGYEFFWQGANHYNTAHPHTHLLINGKAKDGREIDFPPDIVKTFMREYARDICTSQVGSRTRAEIELERSKEPEALRFTLLDEKIKNICINDSVNQKHIYTHREAIITRLENLRKMNLCTFTNGTYNLDPKWEDSLRANSRYNTFLVARSQLQFTDQRNLKIYSGEDGKISGKVTKLFKPEDDTSNNHAVIIECQNGKAFFVPLLKSPNMYDFKTKMKMGLLEGDVVNVQTAASQHGRLTPVFYKANSNNSYVPRNRSN